MNVRKRIARTAREIVADKERKPPGKVITVFRKGDTPVLDMLDSIPREISAFRAGEYVHVSDLIGKCVRQIALSDRHSIPMPPQLLSASMGLTFAQGTAIHDYVKSLLQRKYLSSMYGRWSCACGHTTTVSPSYHKEVVGQSCGRCGGALSKYEEMELREPTLRIKGSPDVVISLDGRGTLHAIEIKSMASEQWKALVRPVPDHVTQVVLYWYLLRELGYRVSAHVSILYATKGFLFKGSPFKEFILDAESSLKHIEDYKEDAAALVAYAKTGELPPRIKCGTYKCPEAKKCHVALECFS